MALNELMWIISLAGYFFGKFRTNKTLCYCFCFLFTQNGQVADEVLIPLVYSGVQMYIQVPKNHEQAASQKEYIQANCN